MVRICCRVVTFAHMHVTGTENQITCTPAIQWLMKVYVNGLLIYNVPHLLSLSMYNWRFIVERMWLRTAAQLLRCNTWQHSSEMWITCTVAIRLVRQLNLICLFVCCRVVTYAHMQITGTENQITCTPAIQWVMELYVNGLLIYNVPHLLSLSVYNWRFIVDREWLRTATVVRMQHMTT